MVSRKRQPDDVDVASHIGNDQHDGDVAVHIRTMLDGSSDSIFWPVGWARLDDYGRELVSQIQHTVIQRERLLAELDGLVEDLRNEGASWTVIGWCTGMTQQAAHKRWADSSPLRDNGNREG